MIRAAAALLGVLLVAPGGMVGSAPEPSPSSPQVTLDSAEIAVGDRVEVRVSRWPSELLIAEVCGNEAARGAVDCAVTGSVQTHIGPDGTGLVQLPIAAPPVGCPCVVRVRDLVGAVTLLHPVNVDGVTAVPAPEPVEPGTVSVGEVSVSEAWSWAGLFGFGASRTVAVTVHFAGSEESPRTETQLSLLVGRGEEPTVPVPAVSLAELGPGQSRTYQIPVSLPPPAFGVYTVRGEVTGIMDAGREGEYPTNAAFVVQTAHYPWGITGILGLWVTLAVVMVVIRATRPVDSGGRPVVAAGRPVDSGGEAGAEARE